ncbi:flagellar biosynthesis protein FlhB [Enterobacter ludwigii]|uniref:flagellar biosynthesis protein FlhB n=1 Tax=Enterobacter ludwigii TaxID=299767 RepID=UPI003F722FEC
MSEDKSEKPTASKLRKAREKGDVPRSRDLTMAAGLLTSLITLSSFLHWYKRLISDAFAALEVLGGKLDDPSILTQFLLFQVHVLFQVMLSLVPIPLACIFASLVPGGWVFTLNKLKPDFKKISPLSGIKRLFDSSHLVELGKMLLKCGIILVVLYISIHVSMSQLLFLQHMWLRQAIYAGFSLFHGILNSFISVIVFFALIDVPLSKFLFTKKMRMTKQEVKDEHKNSDGNPQIKSRIRQLQRQIAMGQIARKVPTADVVITNPTHYAVALKYDPEKAQAPYIVAKGIDDIALYIRKVAQSHAIEVIEFSPLARAVYHTTRVNQQIPAQLFRAIAHVLTYVIRLKSWRNGKLQAKPLLNKQISLPTEVLNKYGNQ